jgi:hypothetical protein
MCEAESKALDPFDELAQNDTASTCGRWVRSHRCLFAEDSGIQIWVSTLFTFGPGIWSASDFRLHLGGSITGGSYMVQMPDYICRRDGQWGWILLL